MPSVVSEPLCVDGVLTCCLTPQRLLVKFFKFLMKPSKINTAQCVFAENNQYAAMTRSVGIDFQYNTFPLLQTQELQ